MKKIKLFVIMVLVVCGTEAFAQTDAEKEGAEVYAKYQAAIGGKENIDKIKTVETESESENLLGKSAVWSIEEKATGRNYYRITTPQGSVIESGFDGERSWNKSEQFSGYLEVTPPSPVVRYTKLPGEKIDDKEYIVLKEHRKDGLSNSKSYYDPETFLLVQRVRKIKIYNEEFESKTTYSDYRKAGDVLVPFSEVSVNPKGGKTTKRIISVKHNVEIKESLFQY